jgi:hypothetical protein
MLPFGGNITAAVVALQVTQLAILGNVFVDDALVELHDAILAVRGSPATCVYGPCGPIELARQLPSRKAVRDQLETGVAPLRFAPTNGFDAYFKSCRNTTLTYSSAGLTAAFERRLYDKYPLASIFARDKPDDAWNDEWMTEHLDGFSLDGVPGGLPQFEKNLNLDELHAAAYAAAWYANDRSRGPDAVLRACNVSMDDVGHRDIKLVRQAFERRAAFVQADVEALAAYARHALPATQTGSGQSAGL